MVIPSQQPLPQGAEVQAQSWTKGEPPCYSCQKDLISCDYCPTQACTDVKRLANRTALVVTKWMRLGPGQNRSNLQWSFRLRRGELDIRRSVGELLDSLVNAAAAQLRDSFVDATGARRFRDVPSGYGAGLFIYDHEALVHSLI